MIDHEKAERVFRIILSLINKEDFLNHWAMLCASQARQSSQATISSLLIKESMIRNTLSASRGRSFLPSNGTIRTGFESKSSG